MSHMKIRLAAIFLALTLTMVINSQSFAQGPFQSDQTLINLVNNDWGANNAQNYALWIYPATPLPSNINGVASYGWLGAYPGSGSNFFQIGYTIDATAARWFVYSTTTKGIVCDRGWYWEAGDGGAGCLGNYWDSWSQLNQFHMVQIDTDLNGTWQAFVHYASGAPVLVAHKYFGTNVLAYMQASSEESWSNSDPYIMVRYYHFHPKYYKYPTGWTDWPSTNYNSDNDLTCPSWTPYSAVLNISNDPLAWFAGTGGNICYKYGVW
jgi:hypothetical protein